MRGMECRDRASRAGIRGAIRGEPIHRLPFFRSNLILNRHSVGVHGFLPRNAFQSSQDAAIVVLVALHGESALFVAIDPSQPDVVFLRLTKRHERTDTERNDCKSNRRTYSSMNILTVADLGNSRCR